MTAQTSIPKQPDDRPRFVRIVPWLALLLGAGEGVILFMALSGRNSLEGLAASWGIETPLAAGLLCASAALIAFVIAYSFWKELPWSRHLLIADLGLEAVRQLVWQPEELTNVFLNSVDTGIPSMAVFLGLLFSYFYLKPNVRAYFRRLELRQDESLAPQSEDLESPHPLNLTLHYTEPLVRRSVRRYCARSIGWAYPVALLLLASSFVFGLARGNRSWTSGLFGAVLGFSILIPAVLYRNQLSAALFKFRSLGGKPIAFGGTEDSFSVQSPSGSAELPWRAIMAVWRYEDLWLLLFSKGHFMTFPLEGISAEAQAFLLERVKAHGGQVA